MTQEMLTDSLTTGGILSADWSRGAEVADEVWGQKTVSGVPVELSLLILIDSP